MYAIQEFARHLAATLSVHLVVQSGKPVGLEGVNVVALPELDGVKIPDGDAILLYADCPDGARFEALPPSKGRKLLFFQGYGTPGNPQVQENLRRGFPTIASAAWLADEASRFGCPARHVPYGLDRGLFHSTPPPQRDLDLVAMMTHALDWKGTQDGLEALRRVREARPATTLLLFGVVRPPGFDADARYLDAPSRVDVARALRESAVFVCPSWEEGFGMPGLEAIACGAALATTDTKGSRDYAVDGVTALVTPPRDPEALAQSVIRLVEDRDLASRLGSEAAQIIAERYHPWDEAAEGFRRAIAELT